MTPEITTKYLGSITGDFVKISDYIKEASYQIRKRGYSEYLIFIVTKNEISIGQLLYDRKDFHTEWHYYATYVDEFVQRKIIAEDKLEMFKDSYKNPDEF